jgi:hypothetical protein
MTAKSKLKFENTHLLHVLLLAIQGLFLPFTLMITTLTELIIKKPFSEWRIWLIAILFCVSLEYPC